MSLDVADLSGDAPVIWYDASDATKQTIVSGKVSQILDTQTGMAYTQATAGKRPTLAAASRNGLDTHTFVRASGTTLANTGFTGLNAKSGATLVAAIKISDSSSNQVLMFPGNNCLGVQQQSSFLYFYSQSAVWGRIANTSTAWRIVTARFNGSGTGNAGRLHLWDNGAPKTLTFSGTVGTTTNTASGFEVGALTAFSGAEFDGSIAEIFYLDYAGTDADLELLTNYLSQKYAITAAHIGPPTITHTADNARFDYVGAWITDGTNRKTVCNGSSINFGFGGNTCDLVFDVTAASIVYPSIAYQVDDEAWQRVVLTSSGYFTINPARTSATSPAANYHRVRVILSIESGYPSANNNYTTLRDACVFKGVSLTSGKNLTKIAPNTNRIEFIGDSLTAGLRVLYTGSDNPAAGAPEINFPEIVARSLGVMPVVMAHGGQGITTSGTDGFPAATASWRKAASGVDYSPAVEPIAVVIYYATNDSSFSQAQYSALLSAVRTSCPDAIIFAVVPYNQSSKAATIQAAVNAGDADMVYLDYSAVIVSADTTDGTHQNPGGAVKIATDLASDIAAEFAERGFVLGPPGTGGSANTAERQFLRQLAESILAVVE
jgi:lysophospholipase L1-like esterase